MPDKYDVCAQIRQHAPYPISNGEHEYTRWGFHKLLEWNTMLNFFFTRKPEPVNGYVELSQQPGIGWEIDESLVESQQVLT